jgi:hypothetical protein
LVGKLKMTKNNFSLDKKGIKITIKTIISVENVLEHVKHSLPENFTGSLELHFQKGSLIKLRENRFFDKSALTKTG